MRKDWIRKKLLGERKAGSVHPCDLEIAHGDQGAVVERRRRREDLMCRAWVLIVTSKEEEVLVGIWNHQA